METKKIHFKGIEYAQLDLLSYVQKKFKEAIIKRINYDKSNKQPQRKDEDEH